MPKNPIEVTKKWATNLGNAEPSIRAGVQAVTESPTAKAAAAVDRQVQGVQRAAASGKTQRGLLRVSLEAWKQSFLTKGLSRIGPGATAAIPKVQAFMTEFLPHVESVAQQVRQMPRGTVEQGIARAAAQIRGNAEFRRSGS